MNNKKNIWIGLMLLLVIIVILLILIFSLGNSNGNDNITESSSDIQENVSAEKITELTAEEIFYQFIESVKESDAYMKENLESFEGSMGLTYYTAVVEYSEDTKKEAHEKMIEIVKASDLFTNEFIEDYQYHLENHEEYYFANVAYPGVYFFGSDFTGKVDLVYNMLPQDYWIAEDVYMSTLDDKEVLVIYNWSACKSSYLLFLEECEDGKWRICRTRAVGVVRTGFFPDKVVDKMEYWRGHGNGNSIEYIKQGNIVD